MHKIPSIAAAVEILKAGGVIAYPTEAVYGLGCDPLNRAAVRRILGLKGRPQQKGLICIADHLNQLLPWLDRRYRGEIKRASRTWPGPTTWVMHGRCTVPPWIARANGSVALRVTAHPTAAKLCQAFGHPIVSTSANPAGATPARSRAAVAAYFDELIDGVLVGAVGRARRPTEIRVAHSGAIVRAA